MQHRHFYTARHAARAISAAATYQTKHGIVGTNMV